MSVGSPRSRACLASSATWSACSSAMMLGGTSANSGSRVIHHSRLPSLIPEAVSAKVAFGRPGTTSRRQPRSTKPTASGSASPSIIGSPATSQATENPAIANCATLSRSGSTAASRTGASGSQLTSGSPSRSGLSSGLSTRTSASAIVCNPAKVNRSGPPNPVPTKTTCPGAPRDGRIRDVTSAGSHSSSGIAARCSLMTSPYGTQRLNSRRHTKIPQSAATYERGRRAGGIYSAAGQRPARRR